MDAYTENDVYNQHYNRKSNKKFKGNRANLVDRRSGVENRIRSTWYIAVLIRLWSGSFERSRSAILNRSEATLVLVVGRVLRHLV